MSKNKSYFVIWAIDAEDCDTPLTAARQAHGHMHRPGTSANVFLVKDTETGDETQVDLDDPESCAKAAGWTDSEIEAMAKSGHSWPKSLASGTNTPI